MMRVQLVALASTCALTGCLDYDSLSSVSDLITRVGAKTTHGSASSLTLKLPAGTQPGDFVVCAIRVQNSGANDFSVMDPAGCMGPPAAGTDFFAQWCVHRVEDGEDSATFYSYGFTDAEASVGIAVAYRAATSATPGPAHAVGTNGTAPLDPAMPGDVIVPIVAFSDEAIDAADVIAPAGFRETAAIGGLVAFEADVADPPPSLFSVQVKSGASTEALIEAHTLDRTAQQ